LFVTLTDGIRVQTVAFEHSIRSVPGVDRFQLLSRRGGVTLKVSATNVDRGATARSIQSIMHRIHPSLASARIEFTDQLVQTVAGKTPMVVLEDSHRGGEAEEIAQFANAAA
jgi:hypothetical protein